MEKNIKTYAADVRDVFGLHGGIRFSYRKLRDSDLCGIRAADVYRPT
ncbi:hypothetical protein [Cohnella sp. GCM10012308]